LDPWRKIHWAQKLKCGCTVPGDDPPTMSAKGFYHYFNPYGPKTAVCPNHGEQKVLKRWEVEASEAL
jgi:hypothetical protein